MNDGKSWNIFCHQRSVLYTHLSPKALSGNLLRKLRTSRFTCDDDEEAGGGGGGGLIKDACSGIPIKTPFQEAALLQATKSGGSGDGGGEGSYGGGIGESEFEHR